MPSFAGFITIFAHRREIPRPLFQIKLVNELKARYPILDKNMIENVRYREYNISGFV